jgi:hypothetical protein
MIRIDDAHAVGRIARAAQVQFVPFIHHCIAQYDRRDVLMGGVIYTEWNGGSCQMHIALWGGKAALKPLLWLGFDYPFNQLGVKKLFVLVPEWNWRSRNLCLHLGYRIEHLADDVYDHKDRPNGLYVMSMRREECRWLGMLMPYIEFAAPERTNSIQMPLAHVPTVGMMQ